MEIAINNLSGTYLIRPVNPSDNETIRDIILETLIEHGAVGEGFASSDSDTSKMFEAFQQEGRKYFVVVKENDESVVKDEVGSAANLIMGGAGIAPLPGEPGTCELVKMYFRPQARGLGLGKSLLQLCLDEAKKMGYRRIYLETIEQMRAARGLYEHLGFEQIPNPMGATGHFSCDVFYLRKLV